MIFCRPLPCRPAWIRAAFAAPPPLAWASCRSRSGNQRRIVIGMCRAGGVPRQRLAGRRSHPRIPSPDSPPPAEPAAAQQPVAEIPATGELRALIVTSVTCVPPPWIVKFAGDTVTTAWATPLAPGRRPARPSTCCAPYVNVQVAAQFALVNSARFRFASTPPDAVRRGGGGRGLVGTSPLNAACQVRAADRDPDIDQAAVGTDQAVEPETSC